MGHRLQQSLLGGGVSLPFLALLLPFFPLFLPLLTLFLPHFLEQSVHSLAFFFNPPAFLLGAGFSFVGAPAFPV